MDEPPSSGNSTLTSSLSAKSVGPTAVAPSQARSSAKFYVKYAGSQKDLCTEKK